MKTVLRNIGQLLTQSKIVSTHTLGLLGSSAVEFEKSQITWIGKDQDYQTKSEVQEVDVKGAFVSPGLVDCHSHAVFAGNRANEFYERLQGVSYEDIQKRGGGIHSTVSHTRAASFDDLQTSFKKRLDRFLTFGVTTLEVKSGYGLNFETEEKILRIISQTPHAIERVSTFLGAHVVPKEYQYDRQAYIDQLIEHWIPAIARQKLATFCDVFCDEHAFSVKETQRILAAAQSKGLLLKLHADQLSHTQGAELAGKMTATSADHLDYVSSEGIEALRKNNTVAVLVPGAHFSMAKTKRAPARALMDAGVDVAISTDCNPGTSCSENLPFMMSLAAIDFKMSPVEIWNAVTVHAAKACAKPNAGKLDVELPATCVVWDAEHFEEIPYRYASCLPTQVWIDGAKEF